MKKIDDSERPTGISDSRNSATVIFDGGKVRAGALSPAFPPTRRAPANATDTHPKSSLSAPSRQVEPPPIRS